MNCTMNYIILDNELFRATVFSGWHNRSTLHSEMEFRQLVEDCKLTTSPNITAFLGGTEACQDVLRLIKCTSLSSTQIAIHALSEGMEVLSGPNLATALTGSIISYLKKSRNKCGTSSVSKAVQKQ